MNLGPRLVIPGTIFGSAILVLFLLFITSGVTYPQAALAAGLPTQSSGNEPVPAENLNSSNLAVKEAGAEQAPVSDVVQAQNQTGGSCEVSPKFPEKILQWCELITNYSNKRGLPPDLVAALILQESGGNPSAYSKSGAVGLMQVMPRDGLAASFMCVNGPCFANRPTSEQLQDPEFNISYGTKMLAELVSKYGDMREALRYYGPRDVGYYYADIVLGHYQQYGK